MELQQISVAKSPAISPVTQKTEKLRKLIIPYYKWQRMALVADFEAKVQFLKEVLPGVPVSDLQAKLQM